MSNAQIDNSLRTLDDLIANTKKDELNVVYVERIDARVDKQQNRQAQQMIYQMILRFQGNIIRWNDYPGLCKGKGRSFWKLPDNKSK